MDTDSPFFSPLMTMDINSRSNHSFAHRVTFLFFQCQFAVVEDIAILDETVVLPSGQYAIRIYAIFLTRATTAWK
jgi:hypothetical protein